MLVSGQGVRWVGIIAERLRRHRVRVIEPALLFALVEE
jgi:hypothetical protein